MTATIPQLEAQISQLASQLATLEARPEPDQLATNAFSLNSKGELEEKLTGHLEADGIVLKPETETSKKNASIEWVDAAGGVVASITGGTTEAKLELTADESSLRLGTSQYATLANGESSLQVGPGIVEALADGYIRTLINDEGGSNFLQLPASTGTYLEFGIAEVKFSAGTPYTNRVTVTVVERPLKEAWWYVTGFSENVGTILASASNPTAYSCELHAYCPEGNPGTAGIARFYWFALTR